MIHTCDICANLKETATHQLNVGFSGKDEEYEWKVCEACDPAFNVLKDYIQG